MKRLAFPNARAVARRAMILLSAMALPLACESGDGVTAPVETSGQMVAGTVEGKVLNAVSREPVAGAEVRIGSTIAITRADGRFELTGLTPGAATLRCAAEGFDDLKVGITVQPFRTMRNLALAPVPPPDPAPPPPPGPPPPVPGTGQLYDLTARIEGFDPAWGYDLHGATYTAVMTLSSLSPGSTVVGTFTNWRFEGVEEEPVEIGLGNVSGFVNAAGQVELEADRLLWWMRGTILDSGDLEGTFFCCGHIGGTFRALRRQTQ